MARQGKRCMTQLDEDALAEVTRLREVEERTESQMISILVKEAIAIRAGRREKASAA